LVTPRPKPTLSENNIISGGKVGIRGVDNSFGKYARCTYKINTIPARKAVIPFSNAFSI
tara:strand:+ start:70 stop:246 length:177 start_codon:yes stop_codon:yes gene_type:complete